MVTSLPTFTQTITLYSQWEHERQRVWVRTVIPNASWYGHQGANIGESGLVTADQYVVRIRLPQTNAYIPPDAWNAFNEAPTGVWTVQNGDVIVKGQADDEVATGITDITRKYVDSFTVTGVYDNRRELPFMQHIRIEGK